MSDKPEWEINTAKGLEDACEWIRRRSDSQVIVAIHQDRVAISHHWKLTKQEAAKILEQQLPAIISWLRNG